MQKVREFFFRDNIGATTITDSYDSSITAVAMGGATCNIEGMALDGVDDYIQLTPWEFGGEKLTIEANVKLQTVSTTNTFLEFGENNSNLIKIETGSSSDVFINTDTTAVASSTMTYDALEWTHLVYVFDSSGIKSYKNGSLVTSVDTSNNITTHHHIVVHHPHH